MGSAGIAGPPGARVGRSLGFEFWLFPFLAVWPWGKEIRFLHSFPYLENEDSFPCGLGVKLRKMMCLSAGVLTQGAVLLHSGSYLPGSWRGREGGYQ